MTKYIWLTAHILFYHIQQNKLKCLNVSENEQRIRHMRKHANYDDKANITNINYNKITLFIKANIQLHGTK